MPKGPNNERKERLKKRQQEYMKLLGILGDTPEDDIFYEEKKAFADSLKELTDKIEKLSPYTNKGKLKNQQDDKGSNLSEEDLIELQVLYRDTINKLNELTDTMIDTRDEGEKKYLEETDIFSRGNMSEEFKELDNDLAYYDVIAKTLSKDYTAVKNISDKKIETNMHDVYETSRINSEYTATVTEAGKNNMGNQNERIAVTLKDKSGNTKTGFFTPDNQMVKGDLVKKAVARAKKKYGKAADFVGYSDVINAYEMFRIRDKGGLTSLLSYKEQLSLIGYEKAKEYLIEWGGNNIKKNINTPEKLQIFIDIASEGFKAQNRMNISDSIKMNTNAKLNRRNAAMSKMAELLGCSDVLAESENIEIMIDGKPVKGTFMKSAIGDDINKLNENSLMLKGSMGSANDLKLKKQVADLQILDFICGNPDRHAGNMLYHFTLREDGSVFMDSIQGIDNDSCMGENDLNGVGMSEIALEEMKVITKEMASRVLKLDKDSLKQMFYGYELSSREIKNMLKRVDMLKKKIQKDFVKYDETYKKGYIIPGTIKVVDDNELSEMSVQKDLALNIVSKDDSEVPKNLFDTIKKYSEGSAGISSLSSSIKTNYHKTVYDFKMGALESLSDIISDLEKDTGLGRSSKGYDDMLKDLKDLKKHMISTLDAKDVYKFNDRIDASIELIDKYIEYKKGKNEAWTREKKPHKVGRQERRFNHAVDAKKMLLEHKKKFDAVKEAHNKWEDFKVKKSGLLDNVKVRNRLYEGTEEKKNIEEKRKENLYQNHLSRSMYRSRQCFDLMNDEKNYQNLTPQKRAFKRNLLQIQYDVYLGFGLNGVKPEDRGAFLKNVSEHTGIKYGDNAEQLIKQGLAAQMVLTKYNLQEKNRKHQLDKKEKGLNEREQKVNEYLDYVNIEPLESAVNNLMESPEFKAFYENSKERLSKYKDYEMADPYLFNMADSEIFYKAYNEKVIEHHPERKPKEADQKIKKEEIPLKKVNIKKIKKNQQKQK